jgi:hypothetical protein
LSLKCPVAVTPREIHWLIELLQKQNNGTHQQGGDGFLNNISIIERTVAHGNVIKSLVKLDKATVTITSRFDGSDKLYDLLLSTAKLGLERNIKTAKMVYTPDGGSCYNKIGS